MDSDGDIAVYTAVFDDYDVLLDPSPVESSIDYFCFTDDPDLPPEHWEPRILERADLSPKLKSGLVKTLPHEFLRNYSISVWVDGNIGVTGPMSEFVERHLDHPVSVPEHRLRTCVYEEADACIEEGIVDKEIAQSQMKAYREEGYPEHRGLSETRVMIRDHREPSVDAAMETWWKEYRNGAHRDQLSFDYAMWKHDITINHLDPGIIDSGYFYYYPHKRYVKHVDSYERLLRWRWNPTSTIEGLGGRCLLPLFRSINSLARATRVYRTEGPAEVGRRFYNRYVR